MPKADVNEQRVSKFQNLGKDDHKHWSELFRLPLCKNLVETCWGICGRENSPDFRVMEQDGGVELLAVPNFPVTFNLF